MTLFTVQQRWRLLSINANARFLPLWMKRSQHKNNWIFDGPLFSIKQTYKLFVVPFNTPHLTPLEPKLVNFLRHFQSVKVFSKFWLRNRKVGHLKLSFFSVIKIFRFILLNLNVCMKYSLNFQEMKINQAWNNRYTFKHKFSHAVEF